MTDELKKRIATTEFPRKNLEKTAFCTATIYTCNQQHSSIKQNQKTVANWAKYMTSALVITVSTQGEPHFRARIAVHLLHLNPPPSLRQKTSLPFPKQTSTRPE